MFRRRFEKLVALPPSWLLVFLAPLSILYGGAVSLHRLFYSWGILKSRALPRPVVSVGNLTVGGGGKTPLVMWLAGQLAERGIRPAILSRGYGRTETGVRIVDPGGPWRSFGDEPLMMARKLGGIPVAVSADRLRAGLELLKREDVDLFILDDGFQHRPLRRDMDIVAVDNRRRFGTGRLLPAGILREPFKWIREADFVVVTRAAKPDGDFESYLSRLYDGPVLWADYEPVSLLPVKEGSNDADEAPEKGPFLAFCGIADPESFKQTLDRMGLEIREVTVFPDHHPFSEADVTTLKDSAVRVGARALVTTEKDAVRLHDRNLELPCYFPLMETVLDGSASSLIERAAALVRVEGERS